MQVRETPLIYFFVKQCLGEPMIGGLPYILLVFCGLHLGNSSLPQILRPIIPES